MQPPGHAIGMAEEAAVGEPVFFSGFGVGEKALGFGVGVTDGADEGVAIC